jgi:hypothetical protein
MTLTWRRGREKQSASTWKRRGPAAPCRRTVFKPGIESLEERCLPAVDVILEWNAVMLQANAVDHSGSAPEEGGPTLTARAFAIVSAAMYDAYNSINQIGDPYLTVAPNASHASDDAAVAQAARNTLVALYPSQQATFDAALAQTLARVPNGPSEDRGRDVGSFVAARILQARANDHADSIQDPPYVPNGLKGFHNVDPTHPGQGFYAPDYQSVTPFALRSANQFEPPALDDGTPAGRAATLKSLPYTLAYYEVFALGGDGVTTPTLRTPEQTMIGMFWGYDGRPGLGTPPRLYNQIVRTVAAEEHNTEAENARLFALVNLAMADAGLVAWNRKYDDDFWRPILGIRGGGSDGNPFTIGDPNWTPLGAQVSNPRPGETNFTPNFPSYTSGHATFGAAMFQTLTRFYGTDDITFTFVSDEFNGITRGADGQVRPVVSRTFHSFSQAAEENGQSRIYLGIHWAFDKTQGIRSGDQVANYIFSNFLRPRAGGGAYPADAGGGSPTALAADAPASVNNGSAAVPGSPWDDMFLRSSPGGGGDHSGGVPGSAGDDSLLAARSVALDSGAPATFVRTGPASAASQGLAEGSSRIIVSVPPSSAGTAPITLTPPAPGRAAAVSTDSLGLDTFDQSFPADLLATALA